MRLLLLVGALILSALSVAGEKNGKDGLQRFCADSKKRKKEKPIDPSHERERE